jgi:gliding motility-associated-like protein
MKNKKFSFVILLFIFVFCGFINAQITLTFSTDTNHVCNGNACDYSGPSILINEVMLAPSVGDGSIYDLDNTRRGEWIELYNPDLCKPVDISCFYLGNNAPDIANYGGGYRIPNNTIVPPRGFVVIRGSLATPVPANLLVQNGGSTIELIANNVLGNVCLETGANRLWFPNAGGWFAFYNQTGMPQDAISWNSTTNSYMSCNPCISSCTGCSNAASLPAYNSIPANLKTYITTLDPSFYTGQSWRRIPDGGAWSSSASAPTIGTCNAACNPAPVITCDGHATVTVSGGTSPYSYIWNDPQASNTATASGLCAGNYCVTVTDADSIQQTTCVDVVDFKPTATINTITPVCVNANPFNLTNYASPAGGIFSGTGVAGANFNPTTAGVGTHTISYVYADTNTCKDSVVQTITVNPLPVATPNITDVLCNGGNTGLVNLTVSGGNPPYTYLWNTIPPQNSANVNNLIAGNYTVTITDNSGCDRTYTYTVTEPTAITINLIPIDEKCKNGCDGEITSTVTGGTAPYSYLWNNPQASDTTTASGLCAGNYTVTVTDANACTKTDNTSISAGLNITADFTADPVIGPVPLSVNFTYTGSGANTYQWSFGDGGTSSVSVPSYVFNSLGEYIVTLVINSGSPNFCTDTFRLTIEVITPSMLEVPNIFTPNGDSYNDEFLIKNQGIETFDCTIYNRWGKKVFEWSDISKGWDGKTEAGKISSDGVYYYIIYAKGYDKVEYDQHGTVTLIK